jgi:outer membrane receptor protein involved in Fe transport
MQPAVRRCPSLRAAATRALAAALLAAVAPRLAGQTIPLEPVTVTAARAPQPPSHVPFSLVVLTGDDLRDTPATTLDGALRQIPGFSLFRRNDSLSANPTAQGVSLRGLGPSGASRSLVLLDGIPLNDPFGGWVIWSQLPREGLAAAEILRGGGATAWGNAALGGVVHLRSEFAGPAPTPPSGRVTATLGDFGTRSAEFAVGQPLGNGALRLSGRDFATDGFRLVAPEDRGPVDLPAWSRHRWLAGRWAGTVGNDLTLDVSARTFAEKRGNGTPYQHNSTRLSFASASLRSAAGAAFSWQAVAYGQDQSFSSTFGSIDAARAVETPASDQYAVPATAAGAAWSGTWTTPAGAQTSAGADFRRVRGETRENSGFSGGAYTRGRIAGGTQDLAGLFALHDRPLAAGWRMQLGGRLDAWRETDGHRRETDLASGALLRDDAYADRDGVEFSPSAGAVWQPAAGWRLRAAVQHAFRRPTLNELYRPFRAGTVITEANAALRTERVTAFELGADYERLAFAAHAAVFWNELTDAVGNVTLATGPGTFPLFGFIPAGGIGRQRLNLDRVRVRGLEVSARWRVRPELEFDAAWLCDDAVVRRAAVAPALAGRRLAQVPRQSGTLGATWRPISRLAVSPRLRWIGRQFEDDENRLVLGAALVADVGVTLTLAPRRELFLDAENLGDARIETGRSATGVVNTGTPRLIFGGIRCEW